MIKVSIYHISELLTVYEMVCLVKRGDYMKAGLDNIKKNIDHLEASTDDAKRKLIKEMSETLNSKELVEAIEFMQSPFFMYHLKDFIVEDRLPTSDSPEFTFLLLAEKYNGNITRKAMASAGISKYSQKKFIEKYELKEINPGYYVFPNKAIDGIFLFQQQYSKAVISHDTALYYHGLNDVIPKGTLMSMPENYKITQLHSKNDSDNEFRKTSIISGSSNRDYETEQSENLVVDFGLSQGRKDGTAVLVEYEENDPIVVIRNNNIPQSQITQKETIYQNPARVTTMERSIVDVLKPNIVTEEEVKEVALTRYFELEKSNKVRLRRIANEQNVGKILDNYLWKLKLH